MSSSPPSLQEVACPICRKTSDQVVYRLKGDESGPRTVVKCRACELLFVSPRITSESIEAKYTNKAYFEREDSATGYRNYLEDRDLHLLFFRRQLDELEKLISKGPLLDVGCAGGFLVQEAVRRGWQAEGVELSPFASQHARETLGLKVQTGSLRGAAFPSDHFRAVFMDDVIEHFEDPLVESMEVARVLEPGGIFVLHTPNAASPWRHLMGSKWVHLKPDEHLFYFDPATLTRLLEKAGFEVLSAAPCSKATNLHYIFGVAGKLLPGLTHIVNGILGRSTFWRKPFPFRGGGMQIVARKLPQAPKA
jgi:SAM-dependent methyltransferase